MIKRVNVYISSEYKQIIIAPLYQTEEGVMYEQDNCSSLPYPVSGEMLGSEVMGAFGRFYEDQKHPGNISGLSVLNGYRGFYVGETKYGGWSAHKMSGLKTIEAFESGYTYISISGSNDSNLSLIIEGSPPNSNDLWVKTSISVYAQREQIGEKVLRVYYACLNRKI